MNGQGIVALALDEVRQDGGPHTKRQLGGALAVGGDRVAVACSAAELLALLDVHHELRRHELDPLVLDMTE